MEFATDSIYSLSPVEAKFAVRCVDALAQNRLESFRDIVKVRLRNTVVNSISNIVS